MKVAKPKINTNSPRGLFFVVLLAVILAVLFGKSFLPGYVHFSNDGPLGQQNSKWLQLPGPFTGSWDDLNGIGIDVGSWPLGLSSLIHWVFNPVSFAKFFPPIALFILGLGAWTFFRQLRLSPLAAVLGALAATLNSTFFACTCWGVGPQEIAIGLDFFALALVVSNSPETPVLIRWARLALAGLAVGMNVVEAADVGAILSVFVAIFVFYRVLVEDVVPLVGVERAIVLYCVNGAFLSLFVLGVVFGLGILKLCLLFVFLLVAAFVLNWSLVRKLIPLTKTERIVTLSLVNLVFLFVFTCGIVHGFGFFPLVLLLIVAVVLNWVLLRYHLFVNRCGLGVIHLTVIAMFAGFIALQTVTSLVGSQISGIAGTGQDAETKARNWNFATSWSEPKVETLGLLVPGLFGCRMDTPRDMMEFLHDSYIGGNYWGTVGSDPSLDPYFEGGRKGPIPPGQIRQTSGQNYLGILVALVAVWTVAQSLRRRDSVFTESQRRLIWFWAVAAIGSLLLAYGRFAPFYQFFYMLPYASTIRIPTKFLIILSCAMVTLFAYGVHALSRRYLEVPAANANSPLVQFKNWWMKARGFDRNWTLGCVVAVIGSFLAWLIYMSEKPALVQYLRTVGFDDENMASQIAAFSVGQAGWFVLLFTLAAGLCLLVMAGVFSGKRAKLGGWLLGILLVVDLGRADLPYIIHWDYQKKYASNPIIDFLRDKPYEHRVIGLPFRSPQHLPFYNDNWGDLYRIEWAQHHFPYYDIQSLDLIQRPRTPADDEAYETALAPRSADTYTYYLMARRWQLTNTRYLLGPAGFLDVMNEQLDPLQHRFRIVQRFDVLPKPGIQQPTGLDELTAIPGNDGACALFDFTGALPRASLYSHWQINTNDDAVLKTLASTNFDPLQQVLVSMPLPGAPAVNATNENPGTVEFKSYAPKNIVLEAKANTPAVLLFNDKYDPHWQVLVDGKPAELLRCNFIMRGVYLTPGAHRVEFNFTLPNGPLYVSLSAIISGILLSGGLLLWQRRTNSGLPNRT